MALFLSDSFTDVSGTLLESHTGETGATWTKAAGSAAGSSLISDANRARSLAGASGAHFYTASGTPANAEYDVEAVLRPVTLAGNLGVVGRFADISNTYLGRYNVLTTAWELLITSGGTSTSLGSFSQTLTAGTDYTLKLEIRNATKKLFVDGVERISSTNNAVTGAGLAGIRFFGNTTNTTGLHFDSISATDAPQTILPTSIASAEAFGSPTVSAGGVSIAPVGIASAEAFGSPTLALVANQTVLPVGIASGGAFGIPIVGGPVIFVSGVASAGAFGSPTVLPAYSPISVRVQKLRDKIPYLPDLTDMQRFYLLTDLGATTQAFDFRSFMGFFASEQAIVERYSGTYSSVDPLELQELDLLTVGSRKYLIVADPGQGRGRAIHACMVADSANTTNPAIISRYTLRVTGKISATADLGSGLTQYTSKDHGLSPGNVATIGPDAPTILSVTTNTFVANAGLSATQWIYDLPLRIFCDDEGLRAIEVNPFLSEPLAQFSLYPWRHLISETMIRNTNHAFTLIRFGGLSVDLNWIDLANTNHIVYRAVCSVRRVV